MPIGDIYPYRGLKLVRLTYGERVNLDLVSSIAAYILDEKAKTDTAYKMKLKEVKRSVVKLVLLKLGRPRRQVVAA
ncbi:hypothetical protein TWF281_006294 [Arthrobotrys megalospora]